MSHCPSHEWDRYNDSEERAALDQWRGEIHDLAMQCFLHKGCSPEDAYRQAMAFVMARSEMEDAMTRPCRIKKIEEESRTWAESLIVQFDELVP